MNKPNWGTKRECMKCGARFYDLKRTKIVCPNCDAPFKMVTPPKATRAIATPAKAEAPASVEKPVEKADQIHESAEDKVLKELNVDIPEVASLKDDDEEEKDENASDDVSKIGEDDTAEVIADSHKIDES